MSQPLRFGTSKLCKGPRQFWAAGFYSAPLRPQAATAPGTYLACCAMSGAAAVGRAKTAAGAKLCQGHQQMGDQVPPLVLLSQRARAQDYQRPSSHIFPVEVAQRYLDQISRDVPAKLLLLSAKFAVELADLECEMAPRKPYQLLGRRDLPSEMRSKAARSMLGYRGARPSPLTNQDVDWSKPLAQLAESLAYVFLNRLFALGPLALDVEMRAEVINQEVRLRPERWIRSCA